MSTAPERQPPVWILVLGLVFAAGSVALFQLGPLDSFGVSVWWVWPVAIGGFVLADTTVVQVHLRSESMAYNFVELPLFLTAIFVAPTVAWLTMTIGIAISVLLIQRIPFVKATFNIANAALHGAAGLWIFHEILGTANPLGPQGWGAATLAAILSSTLSAAIFVVVLMMVQGKHALGGVAMTLFMGALTSLTNVSLALVGASLIDYRPSALVLLIIPTLVLYGAYFAFTSERAQRDRVQVMHELALEVRSVRDEDGLMSVLRLATEHLNAASAELVLFPDDGAGGHATRFCLDNERETNEIVVSGELANALDAAYAMTEPEIREASATSKAQIAGTIQGAGRPLGVLTFLGRLRDTGFSSGDLAMFETMVQQLGLTFEKNQLGQAVSELERRGRVLEHEANHDGLTGLANRAFLQAKLEAELRGNRSPSLLYVDLDDFKEVNDGYGHDAGDEVLRVIARRFESAVGAGDCVARIGGDEFAILLGEFSDDVGVAKTLLAVATEPIKIGADRMQVHASIGVARAGDGVDAAALLKRADVAMYNAKEQGKGTLSFSSK